MLFLILLIIILAVLTLGIWLRERRPKNFPPGPVGLPFLGYLPFLYGDTFKKLHALSRRYGPTFSVKVGSDWFVVLNELSTIKTAFARDVFAGRPRHMLFMENNKYGIGYNDGHEWHEQRKFAVQQMKELGFSSGNLENLMREHASDLVQHLMTLADTPIDFQEILGASLLNLALNMICGLKLSLEDTYLHKIYDLIRRGFIEPEVDPRFYFLPAIAHAFPNWTKYKRVTDTLAAVDDVVKEVIRQHRETHVPEQKRDFVDAYLDKMATIAPESDSDSGFRGQAGELNFVDTVGNLIVAFTISQMSTLSFAVLYLTRHGDVAKKLQAELDTVNASSQIPSPYLEATLAEVLRITSIVAGATLHQARAGGSELAGYTIPKETVILGNMHAVHHDKSHWGEDADEFRPERFLNEEGTFRKDERLSFAPFGTGKRACIGKSTAVKVMPLFLKALVESFDFCTHPDHLFPATITTPPPALIISPSPYKLVLRQRNRPT